MKERGFYVLIMLVMVTAFSVIACDLLDDNPDNNPLIKPSYNIGDRGPAGGIIFYYKEDNAGDWNYLEAAPVEAEFKALWSDTFFAVNNIKSDIGSGKKNTEIIVERFKQQTGNWNTAAMQANDLKYNGFDDWFLPSAGELNEMFGNLKRKNLGGFKDELYWSSTEYYAGTANVQNFKDGTTGNSDKTSSINVRPIRQFLAK